MNNGINGVNHAVGSSRFEITDLAAHNTGLVGYDEQIQIDGAERNFAHYLVTARLTGRQTPLHLDPEEWEQVAGLETDPEAELIELQAERQAAEDNSWFAGTLMDELLRGGNVARKAEALLAPWLTINGVPMEDNFIALVVSAAKAARKLGLDYKSWPVRLTASDVVSMAGELEEAAQAKSKPTQRRKPVAKPAPVQATAASATIPVVSVSIPTSTLPQVLRDALGRVQMADGSFKWECEGRKRDRACGARGTDAVMVIDQNRIADRNGNAISPTAMHRQVRCPACQAAIAKVVAKRSGDPIVWKTVGETLSDLEAVEARLRHNNTLYGVDGVEGSVRPSRLMVELPEELARELNRKRWDWNAIREAGLGSPELMREVVATRRMASSQRPGPRWVRMLWFLERQFEQAQRIQDFRSRETQRKGRARQRAHQR